MSMNCKMQIYDIQWLTGYGTKTLPQLLLIDLSDSIFFFLIIESNSTSA